MKRKPPPPSGFPLHDRWLCYIVLTITICLGTARNCGAQILTNYSLDLHLEGDDPGEVLNFTFPFNPLLPSRVAFNGSFENLDPAGTGVSYYLSWFHADRNLLFSSDGFVPLAGLGQLPLSFDETVEFTPTEAFFVIDGGGPADNFRFTGSFTIEQVPEPTTVTLFGAAALAALLHRSIHLRGSGSRGALAAERASSMSRPSIMPSRSASDPD